MQISIKLGVLFSMIFAITCMWFAIDAFTSASVDPGSPAGYEFAWFWIFLAVVGAAIGVGTWKVARAHADKEG